ncbi:MAG: hypothetical protein HQ517_17515 [SAR324 cluster bacterium]|nr:hypothetical protein [SAR324 cluster bacterium]
MEELDLSSINKLIKEIESATTHLIEKSQGIPALEQNTARILASVQMLKINFCDIFEDEN